MMALILIADDDPTIAGILAGHLESKNHQVLVARDGIELAHKAAEHRPNLIITDIRMPGAYGSSVYQVLQKDIKTQTIPIIFMSAHPFEKIQSLLPADTKTRFLPKPLSLSLLEKSIQELLPQGGYRP